MPSKLKEKQFYCVFCRRKVTSKPEDMCVKVYKNKRTHMDVPALKGMCPNCEGPQTKFIKVDKLLRMSNKYGYC